MTSITLPYKYSPRDYQLPLLQAMDSGYKRAVCLWHRRSGKSKTLVNLIAKKMYERVGSYYYLSPTYSQGRKIVWEGADKQGFRMIDHIPTLLRNGDPNNTEMKIETKNGSIFRVIGTDRVDTIVGTNPVGCVFDEYSLQDPLAWDYIRPILAENGGWAVFLFTPRGMINHGYELWELAKTEPSIWFTQKLTVDDTHSIDKDVLENEKREMFAKYGDDSLFEQEYYCSFTVAVQGSYYGNLVKQTENEKRVTNVPYEKTIPVNTYWDLGVDDSTAIWFTQDVGNEIHVIDYLETNGEGLAYYARELQSKGYVYGNHYAPHDIEVRELGTGKSRLETARSLGINFQLAPNVSVEDGIEAVRNIFNKCWFDQTKCKRGLDALKSYHKEYDEKNRVYKNHPEHDWSEHGASSFRYFAVSHKKQTAYYEKPVFKPSDSVIGI